MTLKARPCNNPGRVNILESRLETQPLFGFKRLSVL